MAIDSAYTSIRQIPRLFKSVWFRNYVIEHDIKVILDIGGGSYDDATNYLMSNFGITNLVYDPFNRTDSHNRKVLRQFKARKTGKLVVCLNVLNVIKDDDELTQTIEFCGEFKVPTYFQVYSGNGKGIKSVKTAQRNQKPIEYVNLIKKVYKGNHMVKQNVMFFQ